MEHFIIMNKDKPLMEVYYDLNTAKSIWLDEKHPKIPRCMWPENINTKSISIFCEKRQPPRTRIGIEDILKQYGLREYMPIQMCKISHGIPHEDFLWIRFDGQEDVTYDSIKIR